MPKDYGHVPGLDDSELLDDKELEQWVFKQEFGPILTLPVEPGKSWIRPTIDEDGRFEWGAFGTVDFERLYPFDKAKYKADKLREELEYLLIRFGIVNERIETKAKYLVLKYLKMGIIELEHIVNSDMSILARLHLRATKLQQEIIKLMETGRRRAEQRAEAFLKTL
jgi:hypothetical protein